MAIAIELRCKSVEAGVFSNERLVRFQDYSGESQAALVAASVVVEDSTSGWVRVEVARRDNGRSLVSLPTADADRIWVKTVDLRTP